MEEEEEDLSLNMFSFNLKRDEKRISTNNSSSLFGSFPVLTLTLKSN